MTRFSPTQNEVDNWIRQDPESPRFLMGDEATAFEMIRTSILKRLLRDLEMWWRQLLNVISGCFRYLGLLFVGIPTVVFWASLLPESDGELPPSLEKLRPPDIEGIPLYEEPSLLAFFLPLLIVLALIDTTIGRGRIGGFRNLFSERAERIALRVWGEEKRESPS